MIASLCTQDSHSLPKLPSNASHLTLMPYGEFTIVLGRANSPTRRFPWVYSDSSQPRGTWLDLVSKITNIYHLDDEESKAVAVGFPDNFGNFITISSEEELSDFVHELKANSRSREPVQFIVQDLRKYEGTGVCSVFLVSTINVKRNSLQNCSSRFGIQAQLMWQLQKGVYMKFPRNTISIDLLIS